MKKVVVFILLGLVLVSCNQYGKPKKPDNLIPEAKMVTILVDLSILSSAKGINKKILENNGISPEQYIYKTHGIDSLQFLNSNKYYSHNTEGYGVILSRVEDSLNKLKAKYQITVDETLSSDLENKQIKEKSNSTDSIKEKSKRIQ